MPEITRNIYVPIPIGKYTDYKSKLVQKRIAKCRTNNAKDKLIVKMPLDKRAVDGNMSHLSVFTHEQFRAEQENPASEWFQDAGLPPDPVKEGGKA